MELLMYPDKIFAQYFRPDDNKLVRVATQEDYATYEVSLYLNEASDGGEYAIVIGPVWGRISDMPELVKEAFDQEMIGWCVLRSEQKEAGKSLLLVDSKEDDVLRWAIYQASKEPDDQYAVLKIA